jgi:hypothetical protein
MKTRARLLSAATVVVVALGSGVIATSASAMNGSEFTKACAKKSNCVPDGGGTGGYIVHGDGSFTVVTCTKTSCTTHKDRKAAPDKTQGQGNIPGQGQMAPAKQSENNGARRLPTVNYGAVDVGSQKTTKEKPVRVVIKHYVVHPQISTQAAPQAPKAAVPVGNSGRGVR